jgi:outer membrane protein assembly factor BamB
VAHDQLVGPPRCLQWIGPPRWPKSHDVSPTLTGLVTAQGRLYYMADTGPSAIDTHRYDFERWHLCARDAFNGVMLWTRPLHDWGNRAWMGEGWARDGSSHAGHGPWISNPRVIHKRLVAGGSDVYATLGFRAPVARIDGATGEVIRTYEGTAFTSEIVLHDGVLFVTVDRAAQRAGDYGQQPAKSVVAIDPDSGRTLWEREGFYGIVDGKFRARTSTLTRLSLTAGDGKVFVHDRDAVVALEADDGTERWRVEVEMAEPPAGAALAERSERTDHRNDRRLGQGLPGGAGSPSRDRARRANRRHRLVG